MPVPSVAVVGGGVIGRTCALELARAGHPVTLLTADPPEATTSAKAAALLMPFAAYPLERVEAWTAVTMARHGIIAADPASGTRLARGFEVERPGSAEPTWLRLAADAARERPGPGHPTGIESIASATLPLVDMSRHLPWLQSAGAGLGVREMRLRIASVDEAFEYGDLVVLATGLETNALVPDADLYPVQGQVVRVANPGKVPWIIDHDHPGGMLYVIPRIDELVIGGTEIVGADSVVPDPAVESAMLARAAEYLPWVSVAPVTSRAVGLRPGRAEIRLERIGDVIHCYGHGGSGVTVAFGCAAEVVDLAAA